MYQDLALCNHLTAASNVFLGREIKKGFGPFKYLDYSKMFAKSAEFVDAAAPEVAKTLFGEPEEGDPLPEVGDGIEPEANAETEQEPEQETEVNDVPTT